MGKIDQACDVLESARRSGNVGGLADLSQFLPDGPVDQRRAYLIQLIAVDLEYRWQAGRGKLLEEYAAVFPELTAGRWNWPKMSGAFGYPTGFSLQ